MKKFAPVITLILLPMTFFFNSCKKDTIGQGNQFPGNSQNVKQLVIKNLSWSYDPADKKAFVDIQISSNYSIDSISNVYRLFVFFNEWIKISKEGTEKDIFYYSIANGKLMLYYIFDINDPNTDVQYLIKNLDGSCHAVKVDFI